MSNKKVHISDLLFGASLKSIRKYLKLTQNGFAEPLSISGSYVSNIEKGEATPSEAVIREIVGYYKINRTYLESGTGDMFQDNIDSPGEQPNKISERLVDFSPDLKLISDSIDIQVQGKTAEERAEFIKGVMEHIWGKGK